MVSSSEDAIRRVIAAFERSGWTEIDIRSGDLRVHVSATAPATNATTPANPAATAVGASPGRSAPDDAGDGRVAADDAPTASETPPPIGASVVVSPSPGVFWRSPEPGLPPFADTGQTVDASATVCIVEVMKLMNHVKAGVGGEVVGVYVENGAPVRKGQALFAIVPSGSPS